MPTTNDEQSGRHARWCALLTVSSPLAAAGWYAVATVLMTWPLAANLTRGVPGDLGDPLFNCWVLGWGADHLLQLVSGRLDALRDYWHANIFYPEPLALAYSEHLFAQAVQIMPIYAATRDLVLCYNLLFFSTFLLSALGMYLLVRELTGSAKAAFVAGLFYAFAPYRSAQIPHLQVLSAQWIPFVLLGFRRHFDTRRLLPLSGAAGALLLQNLSCGYYLIYFAPFVVAWVLVELVRRRRLFDLPQWLCLAAAAAGVAAATWPFLQPYRQLRLLGTDPRSVAETASFSADVYAYLTASASVHLDGRLFRAFFRPEGELFPGIIPVGLALVALLPRARRKIGFFLARVRRLARWRQIAVYGLLLVAVSYLLVAGVIFLGHGFILDTPVGRIRAINLGRALTTAALALLPALALAFTGRSGGTRGSLIGGDLWFAAWAALAAFGLSLGPVMQSFGRRLGDGPYMALYQYVPGFDGLRVPARYGMILLVFLAIMAGVGALDLERRWRRGGLLVLVAGALFLVEAAAIPLEISRRDPSPGFNPLPSRVRVGLDTPSVYRYLAGLPAQAVVVEFPFGDTTMEVDYVFHSTEHWRPLVNGYSGGYPESYLVRLPVLRHPLESPDAAWQMIVRSRATHAVVHEAYFPGDEGRRVSGWLQQRGGTEVAAFGDDRVFRIR